MADMITFKNSFHPLGIERRLRDEKNFFDFCPLKLVYIIRKPLVFFVKSYKMLVDFLENREVYFG